MLRAGAACRPAVSKLARFDNGRLRREFHHITSRLYPADKISVPYFSAYTLNCSKVRSSIWREYRAVRSLLLRSGYPDLNSQLHRLVTSVTSRGLHTSLVARQGDKKEDDENKNDKKQKDMQLFGKLLVYSFVVFLISEAFFSSQTPHQEMQGYVSWNEFVHQMLAKGEVQQITVYPDMSAASIILYDGAVVKGKPVTKRRYRMNIADVTRFEEKLRETEAQLGIKQENGVPVVFERSSDTFGRVMTALILCVIIFAVNAAFSKSFKQINIMGTMTKAKFTLVEPLAGGGRGVKFSDIAGLKEAKIEVMEFVDYLKRPEHYRRLGAKVPKGTLLLGPPGCGKTLLAKAVATEANVPFLSMNGTEFIEMIGGLGASRVRDLFKEARKRAPSIIYIDEIDAIGRKRFNQSVSEGDHTLNQLLVELDGMATNEGVIMLASTNRADILDQALMRPGRFDRHILIDLPTFEERKEIFETHLKSIVLEKPVEYYSRRLAHLTPGFSGADIANICNESALHAARFQQKKVRAEDLEYAVDRVQFGSEKKQGVISASEREKFAYYLAGRTLVGWMLKHTDALLKISIIQRSKGMGSTQVSQSERFLLSNEELNDRMTMHIGGRAAESLIFKQHSTAAEEDLRKITDIAYKEVELFGMNDVVGNVSFPKDPNSKPIYSKRLKNVIDSEARKIIFESYGRAENILKENADKLKLLAEELLKRETLTYAEVCDLLGPPPHGHKKKVEGIDFGASVNQDNDTTSQGEEPPEDIEEEGEGGEPKQNLEGVSVKSSM